MERGYQTDGWPLRARLYARPEISPESNSVQTLQKSFGGDCKPTSPVPKRMQKDHIRTLKIL